MLKWIKDYFQKEPEPQMSQNSLLGNGYVQNHYFIDHHLTEEFKKQLEAIKQAKAEIQQFDPNTQTILEDIFNNGLVPAMLTYSLQSEPSEVKLLRIGKIIDRHIKNIVFTKKLEDIIND